MFASFWNRRQAAASTWILLCSSLLVMACFLLGIAIYYPRRNYIGVSAFRIFEPSVPMWHGRASWGTTLGSRAISHASHRWSMLLHAEPWEVPKSRPPQFRTLTLLWCRSQNPKVDLLVGSAQGSGQKVCPKVVPACAASQIPAGPGGDRLSVRKRVQGDVAPEAQLALCIWLLFLGPCILAILLTTQEPATEVTGLPRLTWN